LTAEVAILNASQEEVPPGTVVCYGVNCPYAIRAPSLEVGLLRAFQSKKGLILRSDIEV